jgi:hypothetical protein
VRVVAAGRSCPRGQRRLRFNQRGVAGTPGAPGTPGTQGVRGVEGPKGDPGSAVVARVRSTSETQVQYTPATTVVALTGVEWSQPAGELEVPYGIVTHVESGNCGTVSPVTLNIKDNAMTIGTAQWTPITPVPITQRIDFEINLLDNGLFEPDSTKGHSITATVTSPCTGGTQTIKAVKVDIAGLR